LRNLYPIESTERISDAITINDNAFVISNENLKATGGMPIDYLFKLHDVEDDSAGVQLIDILEINPGSSFLLQTSKIESPLLSQNTILLWRILLSCGFKGIILPRWDYKDIERGIYLKEFMQSLETLSPNDAFKYYQLNRLKSSKKHPFYWTGYYYLGYDN